MGTTVGVIVIKWDMKTYCVLLYRNMTMAYKKQTKMLQQYDINIDIYILRYNKCMWGGTFIDVVYILYIKINH